MWPGVLTKDTRSHPVQFGPFLVRKELLVGIASGSVQGYLVVVGPDALQVRFAPRGLGRRPRLVLIPRRGLCRRTLARDRDRRQLQEHDHGKDHRGQTDHFENSSPHLIPRIAAELLQGRDADSIRLSCTQSKSTSRDSYQLPPEPRRDLRG